MSPTKFHHDLNNHQQRPMGRSSSDQTIINGPRPSPLKLNKDSHTIHKPSNNNQPPRNGPVIIYTHSPKVIHTQARDFMALVQKLTGLSPRNNSSHPHDHDDHAPPQQQQEAKTTKPGREEIGVGSFVSVSPVMKQLPPANPTNFLADIPLFTPNSTDQFFYSQRPMYRFSDATTTNVAGNCNNLISPSLLEFMKGP